AAGRGARRAIDIQLARELLQRDELGRVGDRVERVSRSEHPNAGCGGHELLQRLDARRTVQPPGAVDDVSCPVALLHGLHAIDRSRSPGRACASAVIDTPLRPARAGEIAAPSEAETTARPAPGTPARRIRNNGVSARFAAARRTAFSLEPDGEVGSCAGDCSRATGRASAWRA